MSDQRLRVLDAARVQLASGRFDPEQLRSTYEGAARQSVTEGFSGLWVSVDMGWARPGPANPDALTGFEADANTLFTEGRLTAVCQYDSRMFPAAQLVRACRAHAGNQQGVRLRHRRLDGGRGLAFTGEVDLSNGIAWVALIDSVADGGVIDITGVSFMDARAMAQLAAGEGPSRRPLSIVATPRQVRYLRMIGVDRLVTLNVSVGDPD